MKKKQSRGQLRLLWKLSEQGYEILFEYGRGVEGKEILCVIRKDDIEVSAKSNNVSSALYVAWSKLRHGCL